MKLTGNCKNSSWLWNKFGQIRHKTCFSVIITTVIFFFHCQSVTYRFSNTLTHKQLWHHLSVMRSDTRLLSLFHWQLILHIEVVKEKPTEMCCSVGVLCWNFGNVCGWIYSGLNDKWLWGETTYFLFLYLTSGTNPVFVIIVSEGIKQQSEHKTEKIIMDLDLLIMNVQTAYSTH